MRRIARHDHSDKDLFAGAKSSLSVTLASFLFLCMLVYCCTVSYFSFFILDSEAVSVLSMGQKETRFHINLT